MQDESYWDGLSEYEKFEQSLRLEKADLANVYKEVAKTAFPNHEGNYKGKRGVKTQPEPLTPDDRFTRLKNQFEVAAEYFREVRKARKKGR